MSEFPLYPLYTYPQVNMDLKCINNNTINTHINTHIFSHTLLYSICKVSIVSNILGLEAVKVNKIGFLFFGRGDFYWEYLNGNPICQHKQLTEQDIKDHLIGSKILGFSPFLDNEHVSFGAIDFDAHTSEELSKRRNDELVKIAQEESLNVYNFLKGMNLFVILNSSGSKGRHVRLVCPGMLARDTRIFLKWVLKQVTGDAEKHEVFPKQDNLNAVRPYGNQIKGLYAIHPKHKKRANIILNGNELDLFDGVEYVSKLFNSWNSFSPIQMPEKDYKDLLESQKKHIIQLKNINSSNLIFSNDGQVPQYCAVIERVLSRKVVPSSGKYNRHACLDPNIAAYGIKHPTARQDYQRVQSRHSNTAFDNWSKYWDGEPVFKCKQVIAYLRHHAQVNDECDEGLSLCANCPHYQKLSANKKESYGFARDLIISQIAKNQGCVQCPKCKSEYQFEDKRGLFYCKTCKYGGGLKKFAELIVKRKQLEAQS